MNGLFNFHFPHARIYALGAFRMLVVTFMLLSHQPIWGQGNEIVKCPEGDHTFTGIPESTLCDLIPLDEFAIQIGAGTAYPKSSLLGASFSGNAYVVGDLEVDAPFVLNNAVLNISKGVKSQLKEVQIVLMLEVRWA